MRITDEKHRASALGLVKFIAAVAIVYFHTLLGRPEHFSTLYLLVELFFFITGYYTFKHFQNSTVGVGVDDIDTKAKKALRYATKKIASLLPYILIAVTVHYVILLIPAIDSGWRAVFDALKGLPFDLLLLNTQAGIANWPMWFLSAMMIVMPVFCLLCQSKNRYFLFIFSSLACLIYYFNFFRWPYDQGVFYIAPLIRAFMGMLMGVNIYVVSSQLKKIKSTKANSVVLQICEIGALVLSFVFMYSRDNSTNASIFRSLTFLSFFIYLCLFMSRQTIASKVSSPTMDFLEKISIIIFMIHIPVLNLAIILGANSGVGGTLLVVLGSIFLSIAIFCIVKCAKMYYNR